MPKTAIAWAIRPKKSRRFIFSYQLLAIQLPAYQEVSRGERYIAPHRRDISRLYNGNYLVFKNGQPPISWSETPGACGGFALHAAFLGCVPHHE